MSENVGALPRSANRNGFTALDAGALRLSREVAELVTTVAAERTAATGGGRGAADPLQRVDAYVAAHLADPALGPETIARAHFVSTRQLHRLFAARGVTVSRHIRAQRLERCRADLAAGADVGVAEVARRWGFGDAASFSRAYRARFGVPPSTDRRR
ncbi:MAG: helix-turn-helix domain-containing protein [Pseudonocardia sp.]